MVASSQSTKIFLVDDHPIVREGLRNLLEAKDGFVVGGEAGSGVEALEKIPDVDPDLAVVDISLGEMDGIELTRRLNEDRPDLKILIVSMHGETRYVEDALQAGASGYVLKDNVHAVLIEAIREVADGKRYLSDDLEERL